MKQQSSNVELFSQINQLLGEVFEDFRENSKGTNQEFDAVLFIGQSKVKSERPLYAKDEQITMQSTVAICGRGDEVHKMLIKQMHEDKIFAEVIIDAAACFAKQTALGGLEALFEGLGDVKNNNPLDQLLAKIREHNTKPTTSKWEERLKQMQEDQRKKKQE